MTSHIESSEEWKDKSHLFGTHGKKSLEQENPMALFFGSEIIGQIKIVLKEPIYFRITCQMLMRAQSLSMCHPGNGKKVVLPFLQQIVSIFIL